MTVENNDYRVYTCGICHKRYKADLNNMIRCAVMHPPNSCCHYGQEELTQERRA